MVIMVERYSKFCVGNYVIEILSSSGGRVSRLGIVAYTCTSNMGKQRQKERAL